MSAVEKIVRIIASIEAGTAEDVANKIKARKKADLKVISFDATSALVSTDEGDMIRIVAKSDAAFALFASFLKRKSSVLLPKLELIQDCGEFQLYRTETLTKLSTVIGDANDTFNSWLGRYAEARKTGRAVRGNRDEAAPTAVQDIVHVGNLRGLVNKLVQFNAGAQQMTFANFGVRENADGSKQIVVDCPFIA